VVGAETNSADDTRAAGATLTISSGTTVTLVEGVGIAVSGIVDAQGTKVAPVHVSPANAGGHHYGFSIVTTSSYVLMLSGDRGRLDLQQRVQQQHRYRDDG
jgi:hypothetical protein